MSSHSFYYSDADEDDPFKFGLHIVEEKESERFSPHPLYGWSTMSTVAVVGGLVVVIVLLVLLCRCCRGTTRGRVLRPAPEATGEAPYPQQQYGVVVTTIPVGQGGGPSYPATGGYPSASAYPAETPHPAVAPYPSLAPYPAGHPAGPYPVGPPASAYPAGAPAGSYPYPGGMPQPAPSAPDAHALPPTYDQVMGAKSSPYNPYAPH